VLEKWRAVHSGEGHRRGAAAHSGSHHGTEVGAGRGVISIEDRGCESAVSGKDASAAAKRLVTVVTEEVTHDDEVQRLEEGQLSAVVEEEEEKEAAPRHEQSPDEHLLINDVCKKDWVRTLATVLAGVEELGGHHPGFETVFYREAAHEWHAFDETALKPGHDHNDFVSTEWRRAALTLTENRTNEFVRTILAVGLYYFAIVAEFVDEISGNGDATPAGSIGAAMALSFILIVTLLSNMPGNFPSRRTCLDAILRLTAETSRSGPENGEMQPPQSTQSTQPSQTPTPIVIASSSSSRQYFDSLPFAGANYSFRPWNASSAGWPSRHRGSP